MRWSPPLTGPLPRLALVLQYAVELSQDASTGALTATSISPVDWSAYGGLSGPCAGSTTPWNTHLGSEEGDPDQRSFDAVRVCCAAHEHLAAG